MTGSHAVTIQPLVGEDVAVVKWVLYLAVAWNDDQAIPEPDVVVQHPEVARYHHDWGRPGDFGVKAVVDGRVIGAAFARLFTEADHGYGYVDEQTPELGVAVDRSMRGRGLGRVLMEQLAAAARTAGFAQLSLSVNNPNPAKGLYEALGYTTVHDDGVSSIMRLTL